MQKNDDRSSVEMNVDSEVADTAIEERRFCRFVSTEESIEPYQTRVLRSHWLVCA